MKLYYDELLNPRKTCAVAKHVNAPVEFVRLDVATGAHKTPDFLAINPNGQLPVLQDGAFSLWESNAIMCYFARKTASDLWPRDEIGQIETVRWLSWDGAHFSRHGGALYFEYVIKPRFNLGPPDETTVSKATGGMRRSAAVLDAHLRDRRFVLGDKPTIADFALAVSLPYLEAVGKPLTGFGEIVRWHDRLNELPAWRDPFPPRQQRGA
jgi:glutathione S-transferase